MREILTQEEVDALLEAYDKGEIQEKSPASTAFYTPFDFTSRKRIGGAQQSLLDMIQDGLAKGTGAFLNVILRREIKVTLSSSYTEPAQGFLGHFRGPCCLGLLSAESTRGGGYVAFTPFLAYALIDLMLGGDGRITEPEDREFSTLEVRMVRRIMAGLAGEITKAWSLIAPARFSLSKVETNPKMIPSSDSLDPLYIMNLHVEVETGLSRDFSIALPFTLIEPLKAIAVTSDKDPGAGEFAGRVREKLSCVPLAVTGVLGEAHLPIREILALKPGDVITTSREITSPIAILVEGKPKLYGRAGVSNGNRAVKITVD